MSGHPRTVSSRLGAWATEPATIVLAIAAASQHQRIAEHLFVTLDGAPLDIREHIGENGGRLHVFDVARPGVIAVDYEATVADAAPTALADEAERIRFLRPSRYCESDIIEPFARANFGTLHGRDAVAAVRDWVHTEIAYVLGSSKPTDGAASTLLARQGVCRDFAHLTTALLRGIDVPARVVSVYAPGLSPMDFHAVTEVLIDGEWWVIDSTGLAPRSALVRIATGADAADIAFFTNIGGRVDFTSMSVMAVADDGLPSDDTGHLARLI